MPQKTVSAICTNFKDFPRRVYAKGRTFGFWAVFLFLSFRKADFALKESRFFCIMASVFSDKFVYPRMIFMEREFHK